MPIFPKKMEAKVMKLYGMAALHIIQRKEVNSVKEILHTKSSFTSQNTEQIKKSVTAKVEKLINSHLKKLC